MKYLILILLFCSCQDEPIEPNVIVTPPTSYQGQVHTDNDNSAIYINGVQYGNGQNIQHVEKQLYSGDVVRLYGESFNYSTHLYYIKLENNYLIWQTTYTNFDTTLIIP